MPYPVPARLTCECTSSSSHGLLGGCQPALSSEFPSGALASHDSSSREHSPVLPGSQQAALGGCSCSLSAGCVTTLDFGRGREGEGGQALPQGSDEKDRVSCQKKWRDCCPPQDSSHPSVQCWIKAMLEKPAWSVPALPGDPCLPAASVAGEEHSHNVAKSRMCPRPGLRGPGNTQCLWEQGTGTVQDPSSGPIPALQSQREAESFWHRMAPGQGTASGCRARGVCMAIQAALCEAAAGHRQLVLQLGGSADGPQLREERHRRSVEVRELSVGKGPCSGQHGG